MPIYTNDQKRAAADGKKLKILHEHQTEHYSAEALSSKYHITVRRVNQIFREAKDVLSKQTQGKPA